MTILDLKNFYKIPPQLPFLRGGEKKNPIFIKGIPSFPPFLKGGEGGFFNRLN